jgi:hypothetical protein
MLASACIFSRRFECKKAILYHSKTIDAKMEFALHISNVFRRQNTDFYRVCSPNAIEKRSQPRNFNDWGKSMDAADHIEVSPKIRVFTPKNAYIRKVWTFIYRFMYNQLGLFAKCLINLEKQKHSSRWNFTMLPRFLIYFFGHVPKIWYDHLVLTACMSVNLFYWSLRKENTPIKLFLATVKFIICPASWRNYFFGRVNHLNKSKIHPKKAHANICKDETLWNISSLVVEWILLYPGPD